jgi:hypothetical protein
MVVGEAGPCIYVRGPEIKSWEKPQTDYVEMLIERGRVALGDVTSLSPPHRFESH